MSSSQKDYKLIIYDKNPQDETLPTEAPSTFTWPIDNSILVDHGLDFLNRDGQVFQDIGSPHPVVPYSTQRPAQIVFPFQNLTKSLAYAAGFGKRQ
jgi:hypothetical protein